MPKLIDKQQLDLIASLLAAKRMGLTATELEQACKAQGLEFDRRTLQRRLSLLIKAGRAIKDGKGRASRYRLAPLGGEVNIVEQPDQVVAQAEVYVPISPTSQSIRDYVRQPIPNRKPVGYNKEFLESYRPNETFYLTLDNREHLQRIGRSPAEERPAGTYARQILDRLLIDLSWASSRLEGNTYTRLDTQRLIDFGQAAVGKDAHEAQMIVNHKAAIEFLIDQVEDIGFNRHTFLNLHALLSENLLGDPEASGRLRQITVDVSGTVFHPVGMPQVIEECFQRILDAAAAIDDPFEQAFFVMVHIPYLQPFEDVNKRVSRLGANIPLIKRNLCPLSFVDVPERAYVEGTLGVYELNRIELLRDVFVWAYERSCQLYVATRQSLTAPDPFKLRYRDALVEVVGNVVRGHITNTDIVARDYAARELPAEDRERFVALVDEEIERLHEGSIARFRLRPSEYRAWKQSQDNKTASPREK